eukprot:6872848-Heterocapsa_arctica.AAC.1
MFITPAGLQRGTGLHRLPLDKRWDDEFFSSCQGLLWEALPAKRELASPAYLDEEAGEDVAPLPVIVPRAE